MAETSTDDAQPGQYGASTGETIQQYPGSVGTTDVQSPTVAPLDAGTAFKIDTATHNGVPTGLASGEDPVDAIDSNPLTGPDAVVNEEVIAWTASEFIAHTKTSGWYVRLALVTLVCAAIVYFATLRDVISTGMVCLGGFLFGVVAGRQPREQQYRLNGQGVQIGAKQYAYGAFRSFSVVPEGAFSSIVFMPLKRFSTLTTIYYAPEDEKRIINLLTNYLPYEEYKHDLFDQLLLRIRF
jgi:hypothetical protein